MEDEPAFDELMQDTLCRGFIVNATSVLFNGSSCGYPKIVLVSLSAE